jgi:hypothetical protein
MIRDDRPNDRQIHSRIVVNHHVAETDHAAKANREVLVEIRRLSQEIERVATVLWNAEPQSSNEVHAQVDRGFARALNVQDDRILLGEIVLENGVVSRVFFANTLNAAFHDGGLVQDDVIHGWFPGRECR